jgi:hypothetical protein
MVDEGSQASRAFQNLELILQDVRIRFQYGMHNPDYPAPIKGSSLFQVGRLNCNFPSPRYIISMRFFVVLNPLALLFAD